MSRVFITGSADGVGKMAAQLLVEQGHRELRNSRFPLRGESVDLTDPKNVSYVLPGPITRITNPTRYIFHSHNYSFSAHSLSSDQKPIALPNLYFRSRRCRR